MKTYRDNSSPQMPTLVIAGILIALAVLARLAPHLPNMTPIAAIALFSGVYLTGRASWLVPIIAMLATDAIIGWYELPVMATVYLSLAAVGMLGYWARHHRNPLTIAGASLAGSVIFFLVTNAGVWAWGHIYPLTAAGLIQSYVNALPFFRNTLIGDLGYTALIFGAYELATRLFAARLTRRVA